MQNRLDKAILDRLRSLPTSAVSDAMDKLGLHGAVDGLRPILAGQRIAGQIVTLAYLPTGTAGGTVGDFMHLVEAGDVIAIDNRGRTDCTVWGNILTEVAKMRGLSGTIIDGVNRDIGESVEIGYPIWSRTCFMRTGKDRVMLQSVNGPICLGTVRVEPGDVAVADDSGVVVVPLGKVMAVLETAEAIEHAEGEIVSAVRAGVELSEARANQGYHSLQTRTA
ncbi:MAG: RraA family protein [Afipia sp.]|nr:RraA family protein [Afipia sp.]